MYNEDLVTLVQFLAIPQHLQLFAYGVRHYMLSDGTMKTVNCCTRKLPGCELFDSFKHQCEATGRRVPTRGQFKLALDATSGNCADKILTALDNVFVKEGIDDFKAMRVFIRDFSWTEYMMDSLIALVDEVEVFMRTDFPQHLVERSSTGMHSYEFAFNSVPIGENRHVEAPSTCCKQCDKILILIMELELSVRNLPAENIAPPETQNSLLANVRERLNHSLLTYMTHVIRSTLNKDRLDSILEHL
jgi:hypothetical protein